MPENDKSEQPTNQGLPIDMKATCTNCGQSYRGGTVTVWLQKGSSGYRTEPRDDVSFRCTKGCDEVHDMDVKVLKRRDT